MTSIIQALLYLLWTTQKMWPEDRTTTSAARMSTFVSALRWGNCYILWNMILRIRDGSRGSMGVRDNTHTHTLTHTHTHTHTYTHTDTLLHTHTLTYTHLLGARVTNILKKSRYMLCTKTLHIRMHVHYFVLVMEYGGPTHTTFSLFIQCGKLNNLDPSHTESKRL